MQTAELKPLMASLVPLKRFGAQFENGPHEITIQDLHWHEPGEILLRSGPYCLLELGDPPPSLDAKGRSRYRIGTPDGQVRDVGLINLLPPHSERRISWTPGHRHSVVCLLQFDQLGLLGGMSWNWGSLDPARTLDVRNERLHAALQWLSHETAAPSFASHLQTDCLLTMLTLELRRHFTFDAPEADRVQGGRLSARQMAIIRSMVASAEHPQGPALADLAQACGMQGRELSVSFKRSTGQTLRSYVSNMHIERAKLLLGDRDLLIKQVAYRSGFRSAAAFGDAFRRATGVTPLQYRERHGIVALPR